jgi:hypothetical protein
VLLHIFYPCRRRGIYAVVQISSVAVVVVVHSQNVYYG